MILETGDCILVSHRRLFDGDEARFFVGEVLVCEGDLVKVRGYSFVRDLANGHIVKKEEQRVKIFSFSAPGKIVYQLPDKIDLENVDIDSQNGEAMLVEGVC